MPEEQETTRDTQGDQALVMQDLLTGRALRHSLEPPVSDFTVAAGVPPEEVLTILTQWQNQGLVFSHIANDDYASDGVANLWKLNWNGYLSVKDRIGDDGEPIAPPLVLETLNPDNGLYSETVNVSVIGSGFDQSCYALAAPADVLSTVFVSPTELTATLALPAEPQTIQVTVGNQVKSTASNPLPFEVTVPVEEPPAS